MRSLSREIANAVDSSLLLLAAGLVAGLLIAQSVSGQTSAKTKCIFFEDGSKLCTAPKSNPTPTPGPQPQASATPFFVSLTNLDGSTLGTVVPAESNPGGVWQVNVLGSAPSLCPFATTIFPGSPAATRFRVIGNWQVDLLFASTDQIAQGDILVSDSLVDGFHIAPANGGTPVSYIETKPGTPITFTEAMVQCSLFTGQGKLADTWNCDSGPSGLPSESSCTNEQIAGPVVLASGAPGCTNDGVMRLNGNNGPNGFPDGFCPSPLVAGCTGPCDPNTTGACFRTTPACLVPNVVSSPGRDFSLAGSLNLRISASHVEIPIPITAASKPVPVPMQVAKP